MRFFKLDTMGDLSDKSLCYLDNCVEGFGKEDWRLVEGEPAASVFPEDARLFMDAKHPGVKLSSLLGNSGSMLIASRAFADLILQFRKKDLEILPFTLYDHRRRVRSRDYVIVNPLGGHDCLDVQASGVQHGPEGGVVGIDRLVFDPRKVRNAPELFRVLEDPAIYIIGDKLAQAMLKHDLTNIVVDEVEVAGS